MDDQLVIVSYPLPRLYFASKRMNNDSLKEKLRVCTLLQNDIKRVC